MMTYGLYSRHTTVYPIVQYSTTDFNEIRNFIRFQIDSLLSQCEDFCITLSLVKVITLFFDYHYASSDVRRILRKKIKILFKRILAGYNTRFPMHQLIFLKLEFVCILDIKPSFINQIKKIIKKYYLQVDFPDVQFIRSHNKRPALLFFLRYLDVDSFLFFINLFQYSDFNDGIILKINNWDYSYLAMPFMYEDILNYIIYRTGFNFDYIDIFFFIEEDYEDKKIIETRINKTQVKIHFMSFKFFDSRSVPIILGSYRLVDFIMSGIRESVPLLYLSFYTSALAAKFSFFNLINLNRLKTSYFPIPHLKSCIFLIKSRDYLIKSNLVVSKKIQIVDTRRFYHLDSFDPKEFIEIKALVTPNVFRLNFSSIRLIKQISQISNLQINILSYRFNFSHEYKNVNNVNFVDGSYFYNIGELFSRRIHLFLDFYHHNHYERTKEMIHSGILPLILVKRLDITTLMIQDYFVYLGLKDMLDFIVSYNEKDYLSKLNYLVNNKRTLISLISRLCSLTLN